VCSEYICKENTIGINPCSLGFAVYVEEPMDSIVYAEINVSERYFCIPSKVGCGGVAKFDWRPRLYLIDNYEDINITIKKPNGSKVEIPIGETCEPVCGITFRLSKRCNVDYTLINPDCVLTAISEWVIPLKACTSDIKINNCTWILEDMICKVKYGNTTYSIKNEPVVMVGGVPTINQLFVNELEAIEAGAFLAEIIDNELQLTYQGLRDVVFYTEDGIVTKTCI
jgi:hypothetical protein